MTRQPQGFTLIETVIAFAIAAVSLAAIYQTFGLVTHRERRAGDETIALLHLASLRDRLGFDLPLHAGTVEGAVDTRYRWHIDAEPAPAEHGPDTATHWLSVTASITWERDGTAHAVSVRTMNPASESSR